jgi:hypothetical protein
VTQKIVLVDRAMPGATCSSLPSSDMAGGVTRTCWSSGVQLKHSSSAASAAATSGSRASGSPSAAFSTSPMAPSDLQQRSQLSAAGALGVMCCKQLPIAR